MTLFFRRPRRALATGVAISVTSRRSTSTSRATRGRWAGFRVPCDLGGAHHLCPVCAIGRGVTHTPYDDGRRQ